MIAMDTFDVFIIGGGAAGSEVALRLAAVDERLRIAIAERDGFRAQHASARR